MDPKQILKFCLEKGLLVDKEVLSLFNETSDIESVKLIIEKIRNHTKQNVITKSVFYENKEKVNEFFYELPQKNQKELESLKIKLGLSIEISTEKYPLSDNILSNRKKFLPKQKSEEGDIGQVKVLSSVSSSNKKIEV